MSFSIKLFIISVLVGSTFLYSYYEKRRLTTTYQNEDPLILKALPTFKVYELNSNTILTNENIGKRGSYKGYFLHFWGTWCAPCEAELPDFIDLAKHFEKEALFVLIAVNDKEKDVKKFIKRFGSLPENVLVTLDRDGNLLSDFGITKVPETYLFDMLLKPLHKYVGPQEWKEKYLKAQIANYLSSQNTNERPVESH